MYSSWNEQLQFEAKVFTIEERIASFKDSSVTCEWMLCYKITRIYKGLIRECVDMHGYQRILSLMLTLQVVFGLTCT